MKPKTTVTLILIILPCLIAFAQTGGETFTDMRDGKTYRTVKIGKFMWMAENLNFVTDSSWCYDDADSNCTKYGRLYNWDAAMNSCPAGWRLPDTTDWRDLAKTVGGIDSAGKKLKSKTGWQNDGNGTDEFGFSALSGGGRRTDGVFTYLGEDGTWWSAREWRTRKDAKDGAYFWSILYNDDYLYISPSDKIVGFSVRCVRDVRP